MVGSPAAAAAITSEYPSERITNVGRSSSTYCNWVQNGLPGPVTVAGKLRIILIVLCCISFWIIGADGSRLTASETVMFGTEALNTKTSCAGWPSPFGLEGTGPAATRTVVCRVF